MGVLLKSSLPAHRNYHYDSQIYKTKVNLGKILEKPFKLQSKTMCLSGSQVKPISLALPIQLVFLSTKLG
jgi:hypothetical protein